VSAKEGAKLKDKKFDEPTEQELEVAGENGYVW